MITIEEETHAPVELAANSAGIRCVVCCGEGTCPPCKGPGHSGFFLFAPSLSARAGWRCKGSGVCETCGGKGEVQPPIYTFRPFIYVQHSLLVPTSITMAAFSGATWRYIYLPTAIRKRSREAQRGWVTWKTKSHYKKSEGKISLFGDITGYSWFPCLEESIDFDTHGRVVPSGSGMGCNQGAATLVVKQWLASSHLYSGQTLPSALEFYETETPEGLSQLSV